MPGINIKTWDYTRKSVTRKKVKRSNHAEALARFAKVMPHGRIAAGKVMKELRMSRATWMRLVEKLKDTSGKLYAYRSPRLYETSSSGRFEVVPRVAGHELAIRPSLR
jgi:hypothetical protein